MELVVRSAVLADASRIAELHLRTALDAFAHIFPPDAPAPTTAAVTRDWEAKLDAGRPADQLGFVAEASGVLVGVGLAGPDPDDPVRGHLSRLYVDRSHWGRGIGHALHDRALSHLRGCGYRDATLWVLESNERARRWYEDLGWRLTAGRKPTYEPAGIDDVRYRISLDAVRTPT